jgi:hypothetical protein
VRMDRYVRKGVPVSHLHQTDLSVTACAFLAPITNRKRRELRHQLSLRWQDRRLTRKKQVTPLITFGTLLESWKTSPNMAGSSCHLLRQVWKER